MPDTLLAINKTFSYFHQVWDSYWGPWYIKKLQNPTIANQIPQILNNSIIIQINIWNFELHYSFAVIIERFNQIKLMNLFMVKIQFWIIYSQF